CSGCRGRISRCCATKVASRASLRAPNDAFLRTRSPASSPSERAHAPMPAQPPPPPRSVAEPAQRELLGSATNRHRAVPAHVMREAILLIEAGVLPRHLDDVEVVLFVAKYPYEQLGAVDRRTSEVATLQRSSKERGEQLLVSRTLGGFLLHHRVIEDSIAAV